ncbi:MAG: hypothetical protein ACREA0_09225 [bacterium]
MLCRFTEAGISDVAITFVDNEGAEVTGTVQVTIVADSLPPVMTFPDISPIEATCPTTPWNSP